MSYQRAALSGEPTGEWTETGSVTGATLTESHAAESGKSHYLCGLSYSAQTTSGNTPDELTVEIKDDSSTIWKVAFQSFAVDDNTPSDSSHHLSFDYPLKITEGNKVDIVITGATGYITTVYANSWGYTR